MPVAVSGLIVHLRVGAGRILPQLSLDEAGLYKEFRPVKRTDKPHARDTVADGNLVDRLLMALAAGHLLSRVTDLAQPLVDPGEGRSHYQVLVAQALEQLNCKAVGQHL